MKLNIKKQDDVQQIDIDYTALEKELKNSKYNGQKEKSLEPNDPIGSLIDQIYKCSLYENCVINGKIVRYPYKLDYNAIHNSSYHAYTDLERDYFLSWANDLKRWVDALKAKA